MITRTISLLSAVSLSLTLLFLAPLLKDGIQGGGRGILMLVLLGIAGGFIHGVGFIPKMYLLRCLFNPWVSWPLMSMTFLLS
jgi:predicted membrane protein